VCRSLYFTQIFCLQCKVKLFNVTSVVKGILMLCSDAAESSLKPFMVVLSCTLRADKKTKKP